MQKPEILETLNRIWREELDNDSIVLTDESTAKDVEEWDSISNIQLVVATEKFFKIRFTSSEIAAFKNVGEMVDAIKNRIG
ncbi:MAG TPA: acyl carrier protein [Bacteroidetes bacterium]|nr:acyl carrier protein [Bacteroidota bacterium]